MAASSAPVTASVIDQKRKYLFKILVIGQPAAVKTAVVHNSYSENHRMTVGLDFALKTIKYDDNTIIRAQLWDIASRELSRNATRVYYKQAVGCLIVFDVTQPSTFQGVVKLKNDLDSNVQLPDGSPVPCVLLANNSDLVKESLIDNTSQMDEFCRENGFSRWFEISTKTNIKIEPSIQFLIGQIMKHAEQLQSRLMSNGVHNDRIIAIDKPHSNATKESKCYGGNNSS